MDRPLQSKKLLELHIDPDHDFASRSKVKIRNLTNWILEKSDKPNLKILDLGCGSGLHFKLLVVRGGLLL